MESKSKEEPFPGEIYMDAMAFGMGASCLQITYESQNVNHATYLHDQLLAFTSYFAALSASAPIFKGQLSDNDMRWTVISQSVDCRNKEERDPEHLNYIPKSRYSTINHYISEHDYVKPEFHDNLQYKPNPDHIALLKKETGLNDRLAFHIASLFIRDPIPSFEKEHESDMDNEATTAHFENIQSTNWNSLRFKPPPT
jgi:glutamate--cysteine ligase catalytic subunit